MSRDEIIANFQAITGIDDVNRSIECLEAHNWNLETAAAVALSQHDPYYQSSGGGSSNIGNSAAAGPTRRGAAGSARIQQDVAAPRDNVQNGAPPQQGIWGLISRLIGRDEGVSDTNKN